MTVSKVLRIVLKYFLSIFLSLFIICFTIFYTSIRPEKFTSHLTPKEYGVVYEDVELKTDDGLRLSAWYIPAQNTSSHTIIIPHGYPMDKGDAFGGSMFLHEAYNLLYFDFRYFGKSEGWYTTIGYKETKDLDAAVKYIKETNSDHSIGIYAYSMGAITALLRETNDVDVMVLDSYSDSFATLVDYRMRHFSEARYPFVWGVKGVACLFLMKCPGNIAPVESVKNIHIPILFIHGADDMMMPYEAAKRVYENANENAEWWLVPDARHLRAQQKMGEEYRGRVKGFFEKWMGR